MKQNIDFIKESVTLLEEAQTLSDLFEGCLLLEEIATKEWKRFLRSKRHLILRGRADAFLSCAFEEKSGSEIGKSVREFCISFPEYKPLLAPKHYKTKSTALRFTLEPAKGMYKSIGAICLFEDRLYAIFMENLLSKILSP